MAISEINLWLLKKYSPLIIEVRWFVTLGRRYIFFYLNDLKGFKSLHILYEWKMLYKFLKLNCLNLLILFFIQSPDLNISFYLAVVHLEEYVCSSYTDCNINLYQIRNIIKRKKLKLCISHRFLTLSTIMNHNYRKNEIDKI